MTKGENPLLNQVIADLGDPLLNEILRQIECSVDNPEACACVGTNGALLWEITGNEESKDQEFREFFRAPVGDVVELFRKFQQTDFGLYNDRCRGVMRKMVEETVRRLREVDGIVTDHLSDVLFDPESENAHHFSGCLVASQIDQMLAKLPPLSEIIGDADKQLGLPVDYHSAFSPENVIHYFEHIDNPVLEKSKEDFFQGLKTQIDQALSGEGSFDGEQVLNQARVYLGDIMLHGLTSEMIVPPLFDLSERGLFEPQNKAKVSELEQLSYQCVRRVITQNMAVIASLMTSFTSSLTDEVIDLAKKTNSDGSDELPREGPEEKPEEGVVTTPATTGEKLRCRDESDEVNPLDALNVDWVGVMDLENQVGIQYDRLKEIRAEEFSGWQTLADDDEDIQGPDATKSELIRIARTIHNQAELENLNIDVANDSFETTLAKTVNWAGTWTDTILSLIHI